MNLYLLRFTLLISTICFFQTKTFAEIVHYTICKNNNSKNDLQNIFFNTQTNTFFSIKDVEQNKVFFKIKNDFKNIDFSYKKENNNNSKPSWEQKFPELYKIFVQYNVFNVQKTFKNLPTLQNIYTISFKNDASSQTNDVKNKNIDTSSQTNDVKNKNIDASSQTNDVKNKNIDASSQTNDVKNKNIEASSQTNDVKNKNIDASSQTNDVKNKNIEAQKLINLINALNNLEYIEYAEPVPIYKTFDCTPNDPLYSSQWNLNTVEAGKAWDFVTNGACDFGNMCNTPITIAIVDDAVRTTHQDLQNNIYINPNEVANNNIDDDGNGYVDDVSGWDAADNDNNANPDLNFVTDECFTHGTHCAGIAAATTNNALGIASVSNTAKIIPVKCRNNGSCGPDLPFAYEGVAYAISAQPNIISMSWGGSVYSATYEALFESAYNNGITLIAAAGNDNTEAPMYPASYNHVISVAALNINNQKADFSNYGSTIDVAAPGVDILSTLAGADSNYGNLSGTSMACPLVSSLAGLMLCFDNNLKPDDIENCLKTNATNIDAQNQTYINKLGAGLVNAYKTITCLVAEPIADINANYWQTCQSTAIQFTDASLHNPTTWEWSFENGTPATSNIPNPIVTFNSNGTHKVFLKVCNTEGCDTLTKFILIGNPAATILSDTTINIGNTAFVTFELQGTPPFNLTYTANGNPITVNNIMENTLTISVTPSITTTYAVTQITTTECGSGAGLNTATVTIATNCNATSAFRNAFGGTQGDNGVGAIKQTSDCGFIAVGNTYSYGNGDMDGYAVKTDNAGNLLWSKAYGTQSSEDIRDIEVLPNGDLFMIGFTKITDVNNTDATIIKTDNVGNIIFEQAVGGSGDWDYFNDAAVLSNGNVCAAGILNTYGVGVAVFNPTDGSILQKKYIEMGSNEYARSITPINDAFLVCSYGQPNGNKNDVYVTLFNNNASITWNKRMGKDEGNEMINDSKATAEGGFILAGYTDSEGAGQSDFLVIKTNSSGDIVWQKVIGGLYADVANAVQVGCNNHYYVMGSSRSFGNGTDDIMIVELDNDGNLVNSNIFNYDFNENAYDCIVTSDCGIAFTGYTESVGSGNFDLLMVKVAENESINCTNSNITATINDATLTVTTQALSASEASVNIKNTNITAIDASTNITPSICNACLLPFADFNYIQNQNNIYFINESIYGTSYEWYFGDGKADTTTEPIHNYTNLGTYTVTLITKNECLSDTITKTIELKQIDGCRYILQPSSINGKDAAVYSFPAAVNNNYAQYPYIIAMDWTWSGIEGALRSYTQFDLNNVCTADQLNSAFLHLYHNDIIMQANEGDNTTFVKRVTSDWNEYQITWNNQPNTTPLNQVSTPTVAANDDISINVSQLVTDMINDPTNSFGFCIQLQTEQTYRRLMMASSDFADANLLPKLEINMQEFNTGNVPIHQFNICEGACAYLEAQGGLKYKWFPSAGLDCDTCATPTACPDTTTTYKVFIYNCEKCAFLDSITVNVTPTPQTDTTFSACVHSQVQLNGVDNALTYSWYPTAGLNDPTIQNPTATIDSTITYTLSSLKNNCISISTYTIYANPLPLITLPPDTTFCDSLSYTINLTPISNYKYEWTPTTGLSNPNVPNPTITVLSPETYILKVTNSLGCITYDTIQFIQNVSNQDTLRDTITIIQGEETTLNACIENNTQYQWSPADSLSCNNCTNPTVSPYSTTTYTLITTTPEGCTQICETTVIVEPKPIEPEPPLGNILILPNAFSPNNDGINDHLKPLTNNIATYQVAIYNRWGEQVFTTDNVTTTWDGTYKNKPVQTGVYVYHLQAQFIDGTLKTQKGNITVIH